MQINTKFLEDTVKQLMAKGKGILAADESNGTASKRLESAGIEGTEENRRRYRELLLCEEKLQDYVSGVILYDETFWQKTKSGKLFSVDLLRREILPGIKVDTGAVDFPGFPGEKITTGLDTLIERLEKYQKSGARFAKWRSVITIDESKDLPTDQAIKANTQDLARYARICQEYSVVPIVEPEVLLIGKHSIETSEKITTKVITALIKELKENNVYLPGLILKTSMVIQGNQNPNEASAEEVAEATIRMLKNSVPEDIGGIVFLSGGQTPVEATAHLDKIAEAELPWEIAFSFARAIQDPALSAWKGKNENVEIAREAFVKRLQLNHLADLGDYDVELEYLD